MLLLLEIIPPSGTHYWSIYNYRKKRFLLHREDGPAAKYPYASYLDAWYLNGDEVETTP